MNKIKALLTQRAKQAIPLLVKLFGSNILSKDATLKKLAPYLILFKESNQVSMPPVGDTGLPVPDIFAKTQQVDTSAIGVYRVSNAPVKIMGYGGVKLGRDVLDLDFGSSLFVKTLLKRDKRRVITCDTCIVLWSHEWGYGYFDYNYFIFGKLLRIKSLMTDDEFKQVRVAYPFFGASFENELLSFAGISPNQIINTRTHQVKANCYYLGNNDSWYCPNEYDLQLIKETLQSTTDDAPADTRIYISRKGRRKLTNEAEVIELLKKYNFTTITDQYRTVAEQIAIYKNAKVIIGPHGASFANIVNCKKDTTLIELFPRNYYPDYFRYLSHIFGLKYYAIFEDDIEETHYSALGADITIDVEKIKLALDHILAAIIVPGDSSTSLMEQ